MQQPPSYTHGIELADTEPDRSFGEDTRPSIHATPIEYAVLSVRGYEPPIMPGWFYRLRLVIADFIDPRPRALKATERRVLRHATDFYQNERIWHWGGETAQLRLWKDAQLALEADTGKMIDQLHRLAVARDNGDR